MHYLILATDYDGTLATNGKVSEATLDALKRLQKSGRKLILVTGRQLEDLCEVFPEVNLFDCVVAENGAVLYFPSTREELLLGSLPPESFVQKLRSLNIDPLSVGKVIVATWEPNETEVLNVIREQGLDLQVIFNKGAVMVLPAGVNKASGLAAALGRMNLSMHNTVAIGDAENDLAFLKLCEYSVAVANSLPSVKSEVDWTTAGARGDGVIELIDRLLAQDGEEFSLLPERNRIILGKLQGDQEVYIQPLNRNILLAGISGGGKSTLATGLLERFRDKGYQFCIIDPEGDYQNFDGTVVLGNAQQVPNPTEVIAILSKPEQNLVVNLIGVKLDDRPLFLSQLLPSLLEMRVRTGRPHWIVIDEVHHMFHADWNAAVTLPQAVNGILMITVHPEHLAASALSLVDTIIAVKSPMKTITDFCKSVEYELPTEPLPSELVAGEAVAWFLDNEEQPFQFQVIAPRQERQRHMRNYAEGKLGEDRSFYFRGEDEKLNLRAHNLIMFIQLAAGVDDRTWLYHLQQQDYSNWLQNSIKDKTLASEVSQIELTTDISPDESRDRIKLAIEKRYTLSA
ncbi:putative HAD superfamily hydrolase (plasmid) [Synechococcus sp. PCC 7502]|uniref:HAD-IIB family hydrolase n=1 Tax=Synechococcus sp. PCC 7502 TaxID=1173263 RepID=UPI00029F9C74|nr:HAD-IIB family hydrolase [Synechococcus sp. PCC 7502]AFY75467.1 putative HAD superfamily hydrolase [Synechococcus sp. PCC 7502]